MGQPSTCGPGRRGAAGVIDVGLDGWMSGTKVFELPASEYFPKEQKPQSNFLSKSFLFFSIINRVTSLLAL